MKPKICAFVPARGGSQGVQGKNWKELRGTPLINWSLEFAKKSELISEIVLSTDSAVLAEIGSEGLIEPDFFNELRENAIVQITPKLFLHKRRSLHAQTLSLISDTLFEFVWLKEYSFLFDFLLLLQPTSPFRRESELEQLADLIPLDNWSSIVSFKETGGVHPYRMFRIKDGVANPILPQCQGDNAPRQLLEELFIKDGAYYLFRKENLKNQILIGDKILPFVRESAYLVNIDTKEDLQIASCLAEHLTENSDIFIPKRDANKKF